MKKYWILFLAVVPCTAFAFDSSTQSDPLGTVWLVLTGMMVLFMQAGFALLESGMSRAKNTVNVIMKNYADVCLGSVAFWLIGYGLMFGENATGWFGTSHFFLNYAVSPNEYAHFFYQMMFAATAVTIASGAMAERTRFSGYLMGAILICAIIYPVYGSWVWGGFHSGSGWLKELGFIDFAGATVVHSVGAWCALAGVIVLGPRSGRFSKQGEVREIPGHNLSFMAIGGFILWFGWFGFNTGAVYQDFSFIGLIALNTHLAAIFGVIAIVVHAWCFKQPVLAKNIINGGLAGLVSVTAGVATMIPVFAALTGFIAGLIMLMGQRFLLSFKVDDVVSAVSVHGFAGAWGTFAAGMFLTGDLFNVEVMIVQMIGIMAAFMWSFPTALCLYKCLNLFMGLRVSRSDERKGLDYTEHNELGYPEFQGEKLY